MLRDRVLRGVYEESQDNGRRSLLEMVSRYARRKSLKCVVVFDGGDTESGKVDGGSPGNIDAIFVKDADDYIRRKISGPGDTESLTVVSSDQDHVARFSRRMGVNVKSAEEFMCDLRPMDKREGTNGEKPEGETKAGVEYWLREFETNEDAEE